MKNFVLTILFPILLIQVIYSLKLKENTIETEILSIIDDINEYNRNFKAVIQKNETQDYDSCQELIKTLECHKIDEWQSEIDKLKIDNFHSKENKIPFYECQKDKKLERMKSLLESSDGFNEELLEIVDQLMGQQNQLQEFSEKINRMFKLPKQSAEFIQKQINVANELNTEVPSIAEDELSKTNEQYNLGDQSISAQTASNEILSQAKNLEESLQQVKKAFNSREDEVTKEKEQLKEGIIRIRALISNEINIQNQNNEKIEKLDQKIKACKNKPMNLEKDCEPIKVRSQKLLTEILILSERTNSIFEQLQSIYPEKLEKKDIQEDLFDKELHSLIGEKKIEENYEPKERKPFNHLKNSEE